MSSWQHASSTPGDDSIGRCRLPMTSWRFRVRAGTLVFPPGAEAPCARRTAQGASRSLSGAEAASRRRLCRAPPAQAGGSPSASVSTLSRIQRAASVNSQKWRKYRRVFFFWTPGAHAPGSPFFRRLKSAARRFLATDSRPPMTSCRLRARVGVRARAPARVRALFFRWSGSTSRKPQAASRFPPGEPRTSVRGESEKPEKNACLFFSSGSLRSRLAVPKNRRLFLPRSGSSQWLRHCRLRRLKSAARRLQESALIPALERKLLPKTQDPRRKTLPSGGSPVTDS